MAVAAIVDCPLLRAKNDPKLTIVIEIAVPKDPPI